MRLRSDPAAIFIVLKSLNSGIDYLIFDRKGVQDDGEICTVRVRMTLRDGLAGPAVVERTGVHPDGCGEGDARRRKGIPADIKKLIKRIQLASSVKLTASLIRRQLAGKEYFISRYFA